MAVQILHWQFTVADYARMAEAGILTEDDRVELIDGEVRAMAPIGPRHAANVNRVTELIRDQVGKRAIISDQNPIRLNDYTEPQPDIVLLRRREDFYVHAHPTPEDVLLIVEVADTSVEYDRYEKVPRYAQAMIPEVWLFDVDSQTITQYADSDGSRYRIERTLERGQVIVSHAVSGLRLSVDSLLG